YGGEGPQAVSAGALAEGRTVGLAEGRTGAVAASGAAAAGVVVLSGRAPTRRSGFFGGKRMLGKTATMSIRSTARITRRSTGSLASVRLRVCASSSYGTGS